MKQTAGTRRKVRKNENVHPTFGDVETLETNSTPPTILDLSIFPSM